MPGSRMNILYFKIWIEEKGASCRLGKAGLNCVLSVDHIEPGLWAALYAQQTPQGLMVAELSDYFATSEAAWQAVEDPASPTEPSRLFRDWEGEQYLTNRQARVERLDL
ncbi:MAG: hypothetical protein ABRQ24_06590 [Syntrophomonadaceae bacterium]